MPLMSSSRCSFCAHIVATKDGYFIPHAGTGTHAGDLCPGTNEKAGE